jgi:DNA-binding protein H-NS
MASLNLNAMSAAALIGLRSDIDKVLEGKIAAERKSLQAELDKLDQYGAVKAGKRRVHPLRGGKVAAKYKGPGGETWSGRGLKPKWLASLLAEGHTVEEFAISGARGAKAGKVAKKRVGRAKKK